ncbi:SEFIR domain-containing protein [Amycolatopsis sp. GM8]|uniref:SEFIR domain-containing protein n=1 Tax=Amycolatopsis sp. GM8 TaxID=2896530 RepID=UPI001F02DA53|nr:SEFIR domain-containing protein [Amycolatopsis sp. GM8]
MTVFERNQAADAEAPHSPRVFISYSHDSEEHKDSVLRFATFLRSDAGVDVSLDRWVEGQRRDWSLWALRELNEADFILVIASPEYRRRADGEAPPNVGRGSQFEAAIIRNNLTRNLPEETRRVLPIVLPGSSLDEIPTFLAAYSTTHYVIDEFTIEGVDELLRAFTGIPAVQLPPLGRFAGPRSSPAASPVRTRVRATMLTASLKPASQGHDIRFGSAEINATHYGESIVLRPSLFVNAPRGEIEFNLARRFRNFQAVAGVLDDATDAGQTGFFQIWLDNQLHAEFRTELGRPVIVNEDISGALRMRLVAYRPDSVNSPMQVGVLMTGGQSGRTPELAWGNPMVVE